MIKLYDNEVEIILSALNVAIVSVKKIASECYDFELADDILEDMQSYQSMFDKLSERSSDLPFYDYCEN